MSEDITIETRIVIAVYCEKCPRSTGEEPEPMIINKDKPSDGLSYFFICPECKNEVSVYDAT